MDNIKEFILATAGSSVDSLQVFTNLQWLEIKIALFMAAICAGILVYRFAWKKLLALSTLKAKVSDLPEAQQRTAKILSFAEGVKKREVFRHTRKYFLRQSKRNGGDHDGAA